MTDLPDVEPCAWIVPTSPGWRYVRPCSQPSTASVTDGRIVAAVCTLHRRRALERGWREAP